MVEVETTCQSVGKLMGQETTDTNTFTAHLHPNGNIYGNGNGLIVTKSGDMATYR